MSSRDNNRSSLGCLNHDLVTSNFLWITVVSLLVLAPLADVRLVDRCEVARAIRDHTTIKGAWNIKQFVCIADKVSHFNTSFEVLRINSQRSVGLFQIPSRFYCRNKPPPEGRAGLCHKLCDSYLDDSIGDDALCASIAYKQTGFRFWKVWYHQCYLNKDINKYIEGCGIE
ncbi:lysozyme C-like [Varroa destructor]|uniref:lysozyme n=2 Tax=Varroa TaxID=62624 RepID=A0A7M7ME92_VARDE|nr:lysozyme C-like [Varroa destructor]